MHSPYLLKFFSPLLRLEDWVRAASPSLRGLRGRKVTIAFWSGYNSTPKENGIIEQNKRRKYEI
jgi:hypothetical protein